MFKRLNNENSSMSVQCYAKGRCGMRHTQLCKTCKNNHGEQRDKNYYKRKENT